MAVGSFLVLEFHPDAALVAVVPRYPMAMTAVGLVADGVLIFGFSVVARVHFERQLVGTLFRIGIVAFILLIALARPRLFCNVHVEIIILILNKKFAKQSTTSEIQIRIVSLEFHGCIGAHFVGVVHLHVSISDAGHV